MSVKSFAFFATLLATISGVCTTLSSWATDPTSNRTELASYDKAVEVLNSKIETISASVRKIEHHKESLALGDANAINSIRTENQRIENAIQESFALRRIFPDAVETVWSRHTNAIRRVIWWTTVLALDAAIVTSAHALGARPGELPPIFIVSGVFTLVNGYASEEIQTNKQTPTLMLGNSFTHRILAFIEKQHDSAVKKRIQRFLEASLKENSTLPKGISLEEFQTSLNAGICEDTLTLAKPQSKIRL